MPGANFIKKSSTLSSISISHVIVNPSSLLVGWTGKCGCEDGNVLFSDSPPCMVLTPRKRELPLLLSFHPLAVWPGVPSGLEVSFGVGLEVPPASFQIFSVYSSSVSSLLLTL